MNTPILVTVMKAVCVLAQGIGVFVPAFSAFTQEVPPMFPVAGPLVGAVCVAVILYVHLYAPPAKQPPKGKQVTSTRTKIWMIWQAAFSPRQNRRWYCDPIVHFLVLAVICLAGYWCMLDLCTIVPREGEPRWQVGFGTADWNLTSSARQWKAMQTDPVTVRSLMFALGGFDDVEGGGVEGIWPKCAVYLAGLLLILLFFLAPVFWTLGWALLAKRL